MSPSGVNAAICELAPDSCRSLALADARSHETLAEPVCIKQAGLLEFVESRRNDLGRVAARAQLALELDTTVLASRQRVERLATARWRARFALRPV